LILLFRKGDSSRFGNIDKSQLEINGKKLIHHITRGYIEPPRKGDHILESLYLSRELWEGSVSVIFGDCYYQNINRIVNGSGFYGRRGGNPVSGKDHGEIYGFTFHPWQYHKVIFWLKICNFFLRNRKQESKLWILYAAMQLKGLFVVYQMIRWILPRKTQKSGIAYVKGNFTEMREYVTEDFDRIEDYAFYYGATPGIMDDFYRGEPDRLCFLPHGSIPKGCMQAKTLDHY
jgi:hypothetical protein